MMHAEMQRGKKKRNKAVYGDPAAASTRRGHQGMAQCSRESSRCQMQRRLPSFLAPSPILLFPPRNRLNCRSRRAGINPSNTCFLRDPSTAAANRKKAPSGIGERQGEKRVATRPASHRRRRRSAHYGNGAFPLGQNRRIGGGGGAKEKKKSGDHTAANSKRRRHPLPRGFCPICCSREGGGETAPLPRLCAPQVDQGEKTPPNT